MVNLSEISKKFDIDALSICSAEPFDEVRRILEKDLKLGIYPPFTDSDILKRTDPSLTMEKSKTFIVILQHYDVPIYKKEKGFYGNIAPSACGEDYHRIIKRKLLSLIDCLKQKLPNYEWMPFVDNSPFSEKHIAVRAGLGKILKNGLFYSKNWGSRCFIGIILTDSPATNFAYEKADENFDVLFHICDQCNACIHTCPGQALNSYGLNSYKCVSYLTQKKDELSFEECRSMGEQVYGCDHCQRICPINGSIPKIYETGQQILLDDIFQMSNKIFKERFQSTAAGWRGKKQFIKNAQIIKNNLMEK